jgi:hypothetical protein
MERIGFETKYIAGKVKGRYLATAVSEETVHSDGAEFYLIEIATFFALGINLRVSRIEAQRFRSDA